MFVLFLTERSKRGGCWCARRLARATAEQVPAPSRRLSRSGGMDEVEPLLTTARWRRPSFPEPMPPSLALAVHLTLALRGGDLVAAFPV